MSKSHPRRAAARLTVLAAALALSLLAPPADAAITPSASTSVWYVNRSRTAAGARMLPLQTGGLSTVAWQHACQMARTGRLYHTTNLGSLVTGWRVLGENVGVGPSIRAIHEAFMASPPHRANVLSRSYRTIGAGVCRDRAGMYWVTHVFVG